MRMRTLIVAILVGVSAMAQDDPLARARAMASAGQRAEALRILEIQMLQHPRDDDARTLYAIILTWDGQLERARRELRAVLANNPDHSDARLALARIEQRSVTAGFNYDDYEEGENWSEAFVELKTTSHRGALIGRVSHASRFGFDDKQFEIEAYPRIGRRAYAFLSIGYAPDATLYPETRFGAELYHAFGRGYEASIGARRLDFDVVDATVYTASLSKYIGNWLVGGRIYDSEDDTALQFMARRYYGDRGAYYGFRIGQGSTRDDVRSAADLQSLDVREFAGEGMFVLRERWVLNVRGGIGQDRYSFATALGLRF